MYAHGHVLVFCVLVYLHALEYDFEHVNEYALENVHEHVQGHIQYMNITRICF